MKIYGGIMCDLYICVHTTLLYVPFIELLNFAVLLTYLPPLFADFAVSFENIHWRQLRILARLADEFMYNL